ncbi:MAG: hypothetical protein KatS3mg035_1008 [Bacteroidia bacterium]|nr:MAG: hypothetical protein KatS3mg035_1008 [Bacteroidia bacterium]
MVKYDLKKKGLEEKEASYLFGLFTKYNESLKQTTVINSALKDVKYCKDGKRICDCMGLICSK